MRTQRIVATTLAGASLAVLLLGLAPAASAQIRPRTLDTGVVKEAKRVTAPRPRPRPGTPRPAPVEARLGLLRIGPALDGTNVTLNAKPAKFTVDKNENQFVIDNLTPGKYTITFDNPDYVIVERALTVRAGSEYVWTPKLAKATVGLSVQALPGTKLYVDDAFKAETLPDGRLSVDDVRIGSHEIKLVKDGYEVFKTTSLFEYQKPVTVAARLVPLASSSEFNDLFDINLNRWTKPATGWALKAGKLELSGAGLGYATNVNYRDVSAMAFHLKLVNGGGAAWAVRIKDPSDYYLFYLSGPKGLFPNYFNTYVVRDGKLDLQNPDSSVPVIETLASGGEYDIVLTAKGNVIEHEMTPASTGRPVKLGVFKDTNSTFDYGGIGFRTVAGEQFQVDDLYVQPK